MSQDVVVEYSVIGALVRKSVGLSKQTTAALMEKMGDFQRFNVFTSESSEELSIIGFVSTKLNEEQWEEVGHVLYGIMYGSLSNYREGGVLETRTGIKIYVHFE